MATNPTLAALRKRLVPPGAAPTPQLGYSPEPVTRAPTAETPASDISAAPILDLQKYVAEFGKKPEASPVRDAIGRALTGFSRGFAATPKEGAYSPVAGGVAGGLIGIGQGFEDDARARAAADEPRRNLVKMILDKQVEQTVKEPFDQAKEGREQAGRIDLLNRRGRMAQESSEREASRRAGDMGLSTSDYLKLKDKAATEAMLRGKLPGDPEYDSLVESIMRADAESARGFGATKVKVPPKPAAAPVPKAAPKTADEYLR